MKTTSIRYDAIVIGTGRAGPSLAQRVGFEGLRVVGVERDEIGGSCLNVGCIPTKALFARARAAHVARRAGHFGVMSDGSVRVDTARVNARMKEISGQSNRGLKTWIERMRNVDLHRGHARFVGPHAIEGDGQRLEADRIFINLGARPLVPETPGLEGVEFLPRSRIGWRRARMRARG